METIIHLQGDPSSSLTPLILVHAISGLALPYLALGSLFKSRTNTERPVYGISSPMYQRHNALMPTSLSQLASQYVEIVKEEIQAEGPYLLGGWSMGGMIAMEMARILQSQGETVEHVIMIDSLNPEQIPEFEDRTEHASVAAMTYNRIAERMDWPEVDPDFEYIDGGSNMDTPAEPIMDESDDDDDDDEDSLLGPRMFFRMQQHIYNGLNLIATRQRKPAASGKFLRATDVTLIRCTARAPLPSTISARRRSFFEKVSEDPKMGWCSEHYRSLRTLPFSAQHDSCLDPQFADELTTLLRSVLDRVSN